MDRVYCSIVLDSQWEGMRAKRGSSLVNKAGGAGSQTPRVEHGHAMVRPNISPAFDYEEELAVIIGRRCRHVKKEDRQNVVAGYSCYENGSIPERQRHASRFMPGKNCFKSGRFGPEY